MSEKARLVRRKFFSSSANALGQPRGCFHSSGGVPCPKTITGRELRHNKAF